MQQPPIDGAPASDEPLAPTPAPEGGTPAPEEPPFGKPPFREAGKEEDFEEEDFDEPQLLFTRDPFKLKEKGNDAFAQKQYNAAVEFWKNALKEALKASVRTPSKELIDLQTSLRLNIALGFMKEEDYIMAKEHLSVVLQRYPNHPKALYRMAEVFHALHDTEKAINILSRAIEIHPEDNGAYKALRAKLMAEERRQTEKTKRELQGRVDLCRLEDTRSKEKPKTARVVDITDYQDCLDLDNDAKLADKEESGENSGDTAEKISRKNLKKSKKSPKLDELIGKLIRWEYRESPNAETADDFKDNSLLWLTPFNSEKLVSDRTVMLLSLSLSVAAGLEVLLRSTSPPDRNRYTTDGSGQNCLTNGATHEAIPSATEDSNLVVHSEDFDVVADFYRNPDSNEEKIPLPSLEGMVEVCCRRNQRRRFAEILSDQRMEGSGEGSEGEPDGAIGRPFTIHVLNSSGYDEINWSALLDRLNGIEKMCVVLVGFESENDPYNHGPIKESSDYLSPSLVKRTPKGKKLGIRIYKGTYTDFLKSRSVVEATKTQALTNLPLRINAPSQKKSEQLVFPIPPILAFDTHPLYPDAVIYPHPNLSRNFQPVLKNLAPLILANIPVLFLGHSVLEFPSHDALQIPAVMRELGVRCVSPLFWNPYMLSVSPPEGVAAMKVLRGDGEVVEYNSVSAQYAVGLWIQGLRSAEPAVLEALRTTLYNVSQRNGAADLQKALKQKGLDVDREETQIAQALKEAHENRLDDAARKAELARLTEKLQALRSTPIKTALRPPHGATADGATADGATADGATADDGTAGAKDGIAGSAAGSPEQTTAPTRLPDRETARETDDAPAGSAAVAGDAAAH